MSDAIHCSPFPVYREEPRTYCYPFQDLKNLTEFEVTVANQFCSIKWASEAVSVKMDRYHNNVQGIAIASLVLSAITVSCILVYLLYSLYSYYRKRKQSVAL
ncbi:hypothetical protein BCR42DRAFT_425461 [Absidia repens]|uniref:Uncharacterized protein n=1 Tax=Absidia repens TaxID=90262 RepID=A0A1X2I377_9FUNG|nr:hypothetical protein BCR42DRAFT_425461 [Absidia repens]